MSYDISKRLRQLRREAHLSQEQTALAANITPAYLGQIERGEKNPTVATIEKLCKVFKMSLSEFFSDDKYNSTDDEIFDQIFALLSNRSEREKQELFRVFKQVLKIRDLD